MLQLMQRLFNRKDEQGASAVEYGLLVAAIGGGASVSTTSCNG
jgi:Flp pilus assembly pilin Flp